MKTRNFILSFLMMMFCSVTFGQNWGDFNYHDYPNNMTVKAVISIDGELQSNSNLTIAPYCGDERRGEPAQAIKAVTGKYIVDLLIYGETNGDLITFKLFDGEYMYDNLADYSKAFEAEAVYGNLRNPENINFKSVAKVGDKKYGKLQVAVNAAEGKTVEVINDVTLKEAVVVAKNTTIDFGNKAITANVYPAFRIQGNANVTVKNGNITNNDYVFVLGASDGSSAGNLTIESGKYVGEVSVASVTKGLLTIKGGEFNLQNVGQYGYTYLINCIDNNYPASANVVVTGGKFYGFNPENNAAEGAGTNFCAEGYVAGEYTEGGSTYYIVEEGGWVAQNTTTGVKYKTLQAAIDACAAGDNTIVLLANISDDVTVNETAGVNIKIEGDKKEYSGTINIVGNSTYGDETLSISNVKFVTSEKNHDFIWSDSQNAPGRYCNNVSVDKCYFVATGEAKNTAVGLRIRQGKNIDVTRSVFEGMHSAMQMNGTLDIYVVGLEIKDSKNGISASGQNTLVVEDSRISVEGYGVRTDGANNSEASIKAATIKAYLPVVVRNTTGAYELTVDNNCTLTADVPAGDNGNNKKAYQVIATAGDDDEKFVIPSSDATATIKGDVKTFGFEAKAGDVCYARFEKALEAAKTNGTDITILQYVLRNTEVTYDLGADKGVQITTGKYVSTTAFLFDANATVKNADFHSENVYAFFVDSNAKLVIEDGKYHAPTTVAQVTKGSLEILGGEFSVEPYQGSYAFLINCKDENYPENANVSIKGGKFHKWNPENNAAEGANTNFCAEGYAVVKEGEWYTVVTAVAKIDTRYYATLAEAFAAAQNDETITLLVDTDEAVAITKLGKNVTFDGNGKKMTAGIVLGSDNNKLDSDNITIKNVKFETKGVAVKELLNVTIEGNTFNNITGDAILVVSDELTSMITVKDNEINTVSGAGINLRCPISATIEGNSIKNTTGNSITLQKNKDFEDHEGSINITNNVMENWANGKSEGRAVRIALGESAKTVVVENNAMIKENAPEEFVKITGYNNNTTISINKNYWNGASPIEETTPAKYLAENVYPENYYASYNASVEENNGLSNLVTIGYVAQLGDVKYTTLQAAVDACTAGNNTVVLLVDNKEDIIIKQVEGVNVTINGDGKKYSGTFTIHGNARSEGAETLTFQNINFTTSESDHIFIDANSTASAERYAHNVTVKDCSFTATGLVNNYYKTAVALRLRQSFNIAVNNCTFNNLQSVYQAYGNNGIAIDNITVEDCWNGISVGTSTNVVIKNSNINASLGYGVRADGTGAYDLTIESSSIKAPRPVVVRETTGAYNLTIGEGVNLTSTAIFNKYQVIMTNGDDDTRVYPTSQDATATINSNVTNIFGFEAKVDNVYYTTLAKAFADADSGDTLTFLRDITSAGLSISKDITIDLGGFNYTINKAVGSQGTESQGFQLLPAAENVTIKNGSIEVAEGTNVVWMFNDYTENLKVENVTIDCENMVWSKSVYLIVANNEHGTNPCPVFSNVNIVNYDVTKRPHALLEYNTEFTAQAGLNVTTTVDGYAVKYVDGVYKLVANMVENTTTNETYPSFAEAIAAAEAGDELKFLANINESVTINKNLTINGNKEEGFSYTGTMTLNNINITIQNVAFVKGQVYKHKSTGSSAEVTIKDCSFDGQSLNAYAVNLGGGKNINIENVTAKDYGYGLLQVPSSFSNISLKNVSISNVNYGIKIDYAGAVSLENVTMTDVAEYGIYDSNYGTKTYTINNCTFSSIEIWERNTTNYTTFKFTGANKVGALDNQYAKYVLADVNATLAAPAGYDVKSGNDQYVVTYENGTYSLIQGNVWNKTLDKKYATLQGAIDAARTGDEIVLLDNFAYSWENVIKVENTYDVLVNVSGKDITLNMNGKTISVDHQSTTDRIFAVVYVENGAGLTVTGNGTIDVDVNNTTPKVAYMFWKRGTTGHLTIENGNYHMDNSEDSMVYSNGDETITVEGGRFILDEYGTRVNGFPWIFNAAGNNANSIKVVGGTYNYDIRTQHWAYEVNVPSEYTVVDNGNGTWTVFPAQRQTLETGWNWFSSYIADFNGTKGLNMLKSCVGNNGEQIKDQFNSIKWDNDPNYNNGEYFWFGSLEEVSVTEMLMIKTTAPVELVLGGDIVNPAETPIALQNNWTWIGYPVATAMNIETAFDGINPQDGDIIKTHNGVAQYYANIETENGTWSGWYGQSLQSMTPGMGYMYYNTSDEVKTLVYPTPNANTRAEVRANVTSENNHWAPKASAFANNMNIIAVLENNDMMGEFEVAAFVNGEVRGSARPTYVEPIDAYVLFMTIYGEEGDELTFKYYDIYSDEEHSINNTVNYSDNAVIGSIKAPYMFFTNTLGMEENAANTLSIYPNPTTTNAAISFETIYDIVEVFNSLGAKVAEYRNVDRIEGMEAAGVYVIRVTNDNAVQNCRLIVK